jgi:hypothetical protein
MSPKFSSLNTRRKQNRQGEFYVYQMNQETSILKPCVCFKTQKFEQTKNPELQISDCVFQIISFVTTLSESMEFRMMYT